MDIVDPSPGVRRATRIALVLASIITALVTAASGYSAAAFCFLVVVASFAVVLVANDSTNSRQLLCAPLTTAEVALLEEAADTRPTRAFAALIQDAARQSNIPPDVADRIREAIRAVGDAMNSLPAQMPLEAADCETLKHDAELVRARAQAEPDPVTRASLDRQADALERSAATAERTAVLARRTRALREEMVAQIEALRREVSSFDAGVADLPGLTSLAESVRTVAAEASAVTAARAELDAPLEMAVGQRVG